MRIIFLDFDGVLNSSKWLRQTDVVCFDPAAVARLAEIVRRTGARIVVTSTSRIMTRLSDMRGWLIDSGYPSPCPIIGATDCDGGFRSEQIARWLKSYGEIKHIESFVILDDDSEAALNNRLVQTSFMNGLEDEHVERAVALLMGK